MTSPGSGSIPPSHPLSGCVAKYQRAQAHYDLLRDLIEDRYGSGDFATFRMVSGVDPNDASMYQWIVAEVDTPPLEWAAVVGDLIHNLRSSLDHLVYELSFLGSRGNPGSQTSFPISLDKAHWMSKRTQTVRLEGLLTKHKRALYRAQPCYRHRATVKASTLRNRRVHPLADLDSLWNEDKHRMILPVRTATTHIDLKVDSTFDCYQLPGMPRWNPAIFGRPLEVGMEVIAVKIHPTGPNPVVNMNIQVDSTIALQDGIALLPRLKASADYVREVVSWFSYEFETPIAKKLWGLPRSGRIKIAEVMSRRKLEFNPFSVQDS